VGGGCRLGLGLRFGWGRERGSGIVVGGPSVAAMGLGGLLMVAMVSVGGQA
jgi:hypothetical protein